MNKTLNIKSTNLLILLFLLNAFLTNANNWTQLANFSGSARHRGTAVTIGNKGYVGFGHINGTNIETYFNDFWEYDPGTNSWAQKANFTMQDGYNSTNWNLYIDCTALEINGEGYFCKRSDFPMYKYSPLNNSWTELNPIGIDYTPNYYSNPISIGDIGYYYSPDEDKIGIYNSQSDTWMDYPNFEYPENYSWINIISHEGIMYFIGATALDRHFWSFDILNNTWENLGTWDTPSYGQHENVMIHQNYIVCTSGGHVPTNQVWAFDLNNKNWIQLENFPGAKRRFASCFTINNMGYITTGTNGVNQTDLWRMDNIVNVSKNNIETNIDVFPNPTTEILNVNIPIIEEVSYSLYNSSGICVFRGKSNGSFSIKRNGLPKGNYILNISAGSKSKSQKVVFL